MAHTPTRHQGPGRLRPPGGESSTCDARSTKGVDRTREATEAAFKKRLTAAVPGLALVPANVVKAIVAAAAIPDPDAPVITDRKGNPLPDPDLRDAENIGFPAGYLGAGTREESADRAGRGLPLDRDHPYAPDAWIDHSKTKIGYEIPFTRHFYEYVLQGQCRRSTPS